MLLVALLTLGGCASVPPESVKLSSAVGQDLLAIKKSHLFYINSYYDRLEAQANRVIDQEYAPLLIRAALNGESGKFLLQKLEAGKAGDQAAQDSIVFTQRFLNNVKANIDGQRSTTIGTMEKARAQALAQTEVAYSQVIQGNATITAYLASLVKLHGAQNELFAAVGVPTLQDDVGAKIAAASDSIDVIGGKAKAGEATIDDFSNGLEKVKAAVTGN